jgi:hypothetical protein
MDPKLLEILKKAKAIDQKAKQYDSTSSSSLESSVNSRRNNIPSISESIGGSIPMVEAPMTQQPTVSKQLPNVDINSNEYKQRVKGSKLPPEIQRIMLENPIPQPDTPGTFSMSEEMIREINPDYGNKQVNENIQFTPEYNSNQVKKETVKPNTQRAIRKMIAEEIAKALPSIVEKYFDKKMIQENVKALNSLKRTKKPQ